MLSFLQTVKLIPALGRMAGFGSTANHGGACNSSEEGHSILKGLSEGHNGAPSVCGTEAMRSTPHEPAPPETLGVSPVAKNQGKQVEQQTSHGHSQTTEIRDLLLVILGVNCLRSSELPAMVRETRSQ
jgi:hypothetical protein